MKTTISSLNASNKQQFVMVTREFGDPMSSPVKAMTASGLHKGHQTTIDKSKAKLDNLLGQ